MLGNKTQLVLAEIFNVLNTFTEFPPLSWNSCPDVCTDGAKAMKKKPLVCEHQLGNATKPHIVTVFSTATR